MARRKHWPGAVFQRTTPGRNPIAGVFPRRTPACDRRVGRHCPPLGYRNTEPASRLAGRLDADQLRRVFARRRQPGHRWARRRRPNLARPERRMSVDVTLRVTKSPHAEREDYGRWSRFATCHLVRQVTNLPHDQSLTRSVRTTRRRVPNHRLRFRAGPPRVDILAAICSSHPWADPCAELPR